MSMIGSSAILTAFGFSLISTSTDFDHGISESSVATPNSMQRALPRWFRGLFAITLRLQVGTQELRSGAEGSTRGHLWVSGKGHAVSSCEWGEDGIG